MHAAHDSQLASSDCRAATIAELGAIGGFFSYLTARRAGVLVDLAPDGPNVVPIRCSVGYILRSAISIPSQMNSLRSQTKADVRALCQTSPSLGRRFAAGKQRYGVRRRSRAPGAGESGSACRAIILFAAWRSIQTPIKIHAGEPAHRRSARGYYGVLTRAVAPQGAVLAVTHLSSGQR